MENASLRKRTVGFQVEGGPVSGLWIRLRHIERAPVRREGDAVRGRDVLRDQCYRSVLREPVDAAPIHPPPWVVEAVGQAVGRVGEIQVAVGVVDQVVRAVETSALVARGQNRCRAVLFNSPYHAVAMAAHHQPAFRVDHQTIRAGFRAGKGRCPRVAAGFHVYRHCLARRPFKNLVFGDFGKEQIAAFLHPYRSFYPVMAAGQDLDLRIFTE